MILRRHALLMIFISVAVVALGLSMWGRMPERVPVHYNLAGEPDNWGPAWVVAVLLPCLVPLIGGFMWLALRIGPFRANLERTGPVYGRFACLIVAAIGALCTVIVLKSAGTDLDIGRSLSVVFGLMLIPLGNWASKLQRNFWMGIRTPWTLANETVWYRTHRIGGRLLMALGVVVLISGLTLPGAACFYVFMSGLGSFLVWCLWFSLREYRRTGGVDDLHAQPPQPLAKEP